MKKITLFLIALLTSITITGCNETNEKEIVVGASSTPHALILEAVKPYVEDAGYELTIKVINDYVTPNMLLESGDIDANYFQHEPYLNDFNSKNNTHIVSVFKVHFEPMGVYKGNAKNNKIAIPNDTSNKTRALELLQLNGYNNYELIELEAQAIPSVLNDVEFACINGNYALSSGVVDKCIVTEGKASNIATMNGNVIAVREDRKNEDFVNVLISAFQHDEVKNYIKDTFGSSVIPLY